MPDLRWWPKFRAWLTLAVERGDWPDSEEFWAELERSIVQSGPASDVTLEACQEAARRLMRRGFPFPSDLHRDLPNELQDVFRAASMPDGPLIGTREEARQRSLDCHCGGEGLIGVRVPAPEDYRDHPAYARGISVTAYCPRSCLASLWLRSHYQAHDPEIHRRLIHAGRQAFCTPDPEPANL